MRKSGLTVTSTFDIHNRKETLILPNRTRIQYIYDARFLREVIRHNNANSATIHKFLRYDLDGNLLEEEALGKFPIHHGYNPLGRHMSTISKAFNQTILKIDEVGNVTDLMTQNYKNHFRYDSLYNLTLEKEHSYSYDSHSCRIAKDGIQTPVDLLHQHQNLDYNSNGDLIGNQNATYTYDALGRLTLVKTDALKIEYVYDPLHRRLSKKSYHKNSSGSWVTQSKALFLYDNLNEIGQVSSKGDIEQFRILGRNISSEAGSSLAVDLNHQTYIPIHDLFGNIAVLLSTDGKVVEQTNYSAFGEETTTSSLKTPNPWHFASKRTDPATGFVLFGRRYYEPKRGSWLTPDPLGFTETLNLYLFVRNNPFRFADLYGYDDILIEQSQTANGENNFRNTLGGMLLGAKEFLINVAQSSAEQYGTMAVTDLLEDYPLQQRQEILQASENEWKQARQTLESLIVKNIDFDPLSGRSMACQTGTYYTLGVLQFLRPNFKNPKNIFSFIRPMVSIDKTTGIKGWKVGDSIKNLTRKGNVPNWNTVRARYWKDQAFQYPHKYKPEALDRMKKGLAPQRINPLTGKLESKELHHNPSRKNGGLFDVIELWPEDHARIDPHRHIGGN